MRPRVGKRVKVSTMLLVWDASTAVIISFDIEMIVASSACVVTPRSRAGLVDPNTTRSLPL